MIRCMVNTMALFVAIFLGNAVVGQQPLLLPPLETGSEFTLTLDSGQHEFLPGVVTPTLGINGPVLGPVLELHAGQQVELNVVNGISEMTTMHWHGMHVAPEHDGGPHTIIAPGAAWSPAFEVMDKAGTYWYHPHLHMMTNAHVSKGLAGMIWVRDAVEQALPLPRTYGVDEFPLILQTKAFDEEGHIEPDSNTDDVVMVNATTDATLEVPAQWVRFHLLNGASQRVFNVGFGDDMEFQVIATEGGLLPAPVSVTRIRLSPGERCEIMVDATGMEGQSLTLMSHASEFANGVYGGTYPGMGMGMQMEGYNPNPLNGADFALLELQVGESVVGVETALPEVLDPGNANPFTEEDADTDRIITMSPVSMGMNQLNGHFQFNGAPFDMEVINYTVSLGDVEVWNILNQSAIGHPFHIHDVQFHILERNGAPPPPEEAGRKDVVFIPAMQSAKFIAVFEDFANPDIPYMYHCHMLTHEDGGMMGQFLVTDDAAGVDEAAERRDLPYPQPATSLVTLPFEGGDWRVVDLQGRTLATGQSPAGTLRLNVAGWPPGTCLFLGPQHRQPLHIAH